MVDRALAIVDHLDILVNNGGMLQRADTIDVKLEEWDYVSIRPYRTILALTLGHECQFELPFCHLPSRRKTLHPEKEREHHQHSFAQLLYWWLPSCLLFSRKRCCSYCNESIVK